MLGNFTQNDYAEPSGQCRLLLVSLLDNFCSLYDRNPAKNQKLFSLLCRKLYSMGILKSLDFMEEAQSLRSIYKEAFKAIVLEAVKSSELESFESVDASNDAVLKAPPASPKGSTKNSFSTFLSSSSQEAFASAGGTGSSLIAAEDVFLSGRSRYREDFIEGRVLGRGGYGKVVLANNKLDGTHYAVKKIQFAGISSQRFARILREVKSLARLDNPHIVRYHSAWIEDHSVILELIEEESQRQATEEDTNTVTKPSTSVPQYHLQDRKIMYIQMELCCFTLDYYIKQRNAFFFQIATEAATLGSLPENRQLILRDRSDRMVTLPAERLFSWNQSEKRLELLAGEVDAIFKAVVKGLHYIHEHGMIHRDLKPMNIFFQCTDDGELVPKIGDFGLVSEVAGSVALASGSESDSERTGSLDKENSANNNTMQTNAALTKGLGTITYAAPEQLHQQDYTQKSDIYSLGIICFELFHPTGTQMERTRLLEDLKRNHRFPDEFLKRWPKEAAFIWSCIAKDASLRPSTKEILESEWLDRDAEEMMSQLAQENRLLRRMLKEQELLIASLQKQLRIEPE